MHRPRRIIALLQPGPGTSPHQTGNQPGPVQHLKLAEADDGSGVEGLPVLLH